MLRLQVVKAEDRDLLWNINQKYLYEMTGFYDDPMDEKGNYHYGHFDDYFSDPKRVAYFIYNDDVLVGFAMLCPYSNIGQNPDYTMAEFTIFPSFRRKHFALDVVKMILLKHPGRWEIKYNEKNYGAKKLWNAVAEPYKPEIHHLNEDETVLSFEVEGKIIAACGNVCTACPRYIAHPYEKTADELQHTAELWMKIGYRDHIVTNEEISCTGCKPENWCRYHVVKCCQERDISTCGDCPDYPCDNMKECFEVTKSFEPACRKACTDEEYETLKMAFFEKEKNLNTKGKKKMLETERLILRRWEESDAEDLYKYASDPDVGPIAGWPAHQSIDESRGVIKNVLSGKEAYDICLKEDGRAIGAIELKLNGHTDMTDRDDECEMGYWLGKPFWGQGIMPEAVKEMLRHAFEELGMQKVWIGYYEGNAKSKRVQEKCGFKYQWRSENVDVPLMHEKRTGHVSLMTKEDWLSKQ